jgi:hypothetical protein
MGKMYYTEEEAAGKLGVDAKQLQQLVEEAKLHVYTDAGRRMYKVAEVDALAPPSSDESGEIELTPADTADRDVVTLSEAEKPPEAVGKEDTVITTEGISIFDDEELEVEAADPMAKTSIASVEDVASPEGVGSGSGLLDLTREPDDTSLGAVLEDISVESAVGSSAAAEALAEEMPSEAEPTSAVIEAPTMVAAIDPSAGAFSGIAVATCLLMLVLGAVAVAVLHGATPRYLQALEQNLLIFLAAGAAAAVLLAVAGYLVGKSVADRAAALQRSRGS